MPTVSLGSFEDGAVRVEMDVDASDNITAVRAINDDPLGRDLGVEVVQGEGRPNAGRTTTLRRFGPGTTEFVIPTTAAQRIRGVWDGRRWVGIDVRILFPYTA